MKKVLTVAVFALSLCAFALNETYDPIVPDHGEVVPGVWNSSTVKGDAYARQHNVPILAIAASRFCGHCHTLQTACNTDEFKRWQAEKKLVMVFGEDSKTKLYCKDGPGGDLSSFPFVRIVWYKKDGTVFSTHFSGTVDAMPAKGDTLAAAIINSVELYLAAYPYAGGEFLNAGSSSDRLELEEGYDASKPVVVPLKRSSALIAAKNVLVCDKVEYPVEWAADESGVKYVEIAAPDGLKAGSSIPLELYLDGELHSCSSITVVKRLPVQVHNPLFLGERTIDTLAYGEWTMDYELAKAKVLRDRAAGIDANMLVFVTGTLWCPNCFAIDTNLLEVVQSDGTVKTPVYDWARANNVALVFLDQGRAGTDEAGFPNGMDKPRLLSYVPYGDTVSGASYMSRHRISVEDAHAVKVWAGKYSSGKWLAPETTATRLSQPTILLVDPETEAVRARFASYRDSSPSRVFVVEENLARLNDLLLVGDDGEIDSYVTTTRRSIACGEGGAAAEFQINDKTKVFRVEKIPHGQVTFKVLSKSRADREIKFSLIAVDGKGVQSVVATGIDSVSFDFTGVADGSFYLKASAFGEAREYGANTTFSAEFGTAVKLIPGEIGFDFAQQRFFGKEDVGTVSISRRGGASGAAAVKVRLVSGTAVNGKRMQWKDTDVVWADGEGGTKTVDFTILHPQGAAQREDFRLSLESAEGSAAAIGGHETLEVVIFDSDLPTLPEEKYSIVLYRGFDAALAFADDVYNVEPLAKVKINVSEGKMPSGVKLTFDQNARKMTFKGAPKKTGMSTVVCSLADKSVSKEFGPSTTMDIVVKEPTEENPFVFREIKLDLPLFRVDGDVRTLDGLVDLKVTAKGKITAKYVSLGNAKKVSLKGLWGMLEDGVAKAFLTSRKGEATLGLALDREGYVCAELVDGRAGGRMCSSGRFYAFPTSAGARCAAGYTVVLPEIAGSDTAGASALLLKISPNGKVKWKASLADGASVSDTTYTLLGEDGLAFVPAFKISSKGAFSAPLVVRTTSGRTARAVRLADGTVACWSRFGIDHRCKAWGSRFDGSANLGELCLASSMPTTLIAYCDWREFSGSGKYGAVTAGPEVEVSVGAKKIEPVVKTKELKLSVAKTGLVKGSAMVAFDDKLVKVKLVGAVVPNWYDCGCEAPDPEDRFAIVDSLPFVCGAAYFKDVVGGVSRYRGFKLSVGLKDE